MLWWYYSMLRNVVQLVLNAIVDVFLNVFLNAILNIFKIWSVLFGLFFWFYNAECLSVYNCILKVFSSDVFLLFIYIICCRSSRLSPRTCCVSCSSHTPFCSCFVQLALQAQTGTKHERQCAPRDGSLATVCGNSRGSSIVHIWRFPKQKMPLILLSDTF